MTPHFNFKCSYLGNLSYAVSDDTGVYEAEVRRDLISYDDYHYNGTRGEYARDIEESLNLLHRHCESWLPMPAATIAAFNAWLVAEDERMKSHILGNPTRYGITSPNDPFFQAPKPAAGAHYEVGKGWIIDTPLPPANTPAGS